MASAEFMPGRCMAAGCRNRATHAYAVTTPSMGYPLRKDSTLATLYLTFYVCADHRAAVTREAALTPETRAVIAAAFVRAKTPTPPDFMRATVKPVPLTDAGWIRFVNGLRAVSANAQGRG